MIINKASRNLQLWTRRQGLSGSKQEEKEKEKRVFQVMKVFSLLEYLLLSEKCWAFTICLNVFSPLCDIMLGVLFSPCRFDVSAEDNFSFVCLFSSVQCREREGQKKRGQKTVVVSATWSRRSEVVVFSGWPVIPNLQRVKKDQF